MMRICAAMALTVFLTIPIVAPGQPAHWDGPLMRPTERQNVFAFARKPTARKTGKDRYEISFAVTSHCDVTVAIHDAEGKAVRFIVSGVLGANAPEPLKKNSLDQAIMWDGKDNSGAMCHTPLKARISGSSPTKNP